MGAFISPTTRISGCIALGRHRAYLISGPAPPQRRAALPPIRGARPRPLTGTMVPPRAARSSSDDDRGVELAAPGTTSPPRVRRGGKKKKGKKKKPAQSKFAPLPNLPVSPRASLQERTSFDVERAALLPPEAGAGPSGGGPKAEEAVDWVMTALLFLFPAVGGLLFGYDIGATR